MKKRKQTPGGDEVVMLDTPAKCRAFLKSLRFPSDDGKPNGIRFLQQEDGSQVTIDDASDQQVVRLAAEFAESLNRSSAH